MNLCGSCNQDFGSVSAFDAHRVGRHEYLADKDHPDGRRCLSVQEMLADKKGFVRNSYGRWSLSDALERARSLGESTPEANTGHQMTIDECIADAEAEA